MMRAEVTTMGVGAGVGFNFFTFVRTCDTLWICFGGDEGVQAERMVACESEHVESKLSPQADRPRSRSTRNTTGRDRYKWSSSELEVRCIVATCFLYDTDYIGNKSYETH